MKTTWSKNLSIRPEQKADIQTLFTYMNARGLKFSKKRAAVIEYFVNTDRHFTVEQLYLELKKKCRIGYSTVYRTLRLLVDSGVAVIHHFGAENTRFELVHKEEHHDHFVCRKCGKIIEFRHNGVERLQQEVALTYGFTVDDHELQFFGLCKTCRSGKRKKGNFR